MRCKCFGRARCNGIAVAKLHGQDTLCASGITGDQIAAAVFIQIRRGERERSLLGRGELRAKLRAAAEALRLRGVPMEVAIVNMLRLQCNRAGEKKP